jgi:hypothetical protein
LEIELTDACVPVKTAGGGVVFARVPEAHAIGRIDSRHAIIAPAVEGVSLAPGAVEHYSFPLAKVIRRVGGKTPGITNAREHRRTGYGVARGNVPSLIDGDAGHKAP